MGRQEEDIRDMLAFQAGQDLAFHRLFEKYRRPIVNYLYRFFWNRAIAEELTQEVFLRVCRGAKTYEPRTAFRNWIYQIATNVARNEARRYEYSVRREPLSEHPSREDGSGDQDCLDSGGGSPEDLTTTSRLEQEIQTVLSNLPPNQRTALLLCRQHGFAYREIATIMHLREGAVKSLIHRATESLRRDLAPYLEPSRVDPIRPCAGGEDAL